MTHHQNIQFQDKDRRDARSWRARQEKPHDPRERFVRQNKFITWGEQESYHLFHIPHIPSEMRNWTPTAQQID